MRTIIKKIDRGLFFLAKRIVGVIKPAKGTHIALSYYRRRGMKLIGRPNYISSTAWFDGTDYGLITIGNGATISSNVSVLTHDWALHTIGRSLGRVTKAPLGRIQAVVIGDFCFVGRGATLMPGCILGRGCIIGSGAVVRGKIPDYSIVVGNPGTVTGNSRDYYFKFEKRQLNTDS